MKHWCGVYLGWGWGWSIPGGILVLWSRVTPRDGMGTLGTKPESYCCCSNMQSEFGPDGESWVCYLWFMVSITEKWKRDRTKLLNQKNLLNQKKKKKITPGMKESMTRSHSLSRSKRKTSYTVFMNWKEAEANPQERLWRKILTCLSGSLKLFPSGTTRILEMVGGALITHLLEAGFGFWAIPSNPQGLLSQGWRTI